MLAQQQCAKWLKLASRWDWREPAAIDFQMHTLWTDGRSTTAEMIQGAKNVGLKAIAITEHLNQQSTYYPDFVTEVERLRAQELDLEIYYGVEVAVEDCQGTLKTQRHLDEAEIILGVVHSYPKPSGGYYHWNELTAEDALTIEMRALEGLANNGQIHVIGHPGGTYFKKFGPFPVEHMAPAFRIARENGIAVEFNTQYCWDPHAFSELLTDINPLVSFGSDAHEAAKVGSNCHAMRSWFAERKGDVIYD